MSDSKKIAKIISFLENAPYHERKEYTKELRVNKSVRIKGYVIQNEVYCYVVWKSTDIGDEPQYKGEPLYKVVPKDCTKKQIESILDSQSWIYP